MKKHKVIKKEDGRLDYLRNEGCKGKGLDRGQTAGNRGLARASIGVYWGRDIKRKAAA
jgi:hypothetical protein